MQKRVAKLVNRRIYFMTKRPRSRIAERRNRTNHREELTFTDALKALKKYKENRTGDSKLTYKEVKKLKEAWMRRSTRRLVEADIQAMNADPNMGMDMGQQMGMDQAFAGEANVDPVVQGQIQTVVDSVNALAASVGIAQENDLEGDPAANIGAVEGQPMMDDGMMQQAPQTLGEAIRAYQKYKMARGYGSRVTESEKRKLARRIRENRMKKRAALREFVKTEEAKQLRRNRLSESTLRKRAMEVVRESNSLERRIKERKARIASLQEGTTEFAKDELKRLGAPMEFRSSLHKRHADSEFGVKVPSAETLANGHAGKASMKPADRWPTKKVSGKSLQGEGTKMTEAKSVTDTYVDNFLSEDKLSFEKIKESMKNGILG
jgi:hypothetical protein